MNTNKIKAELLDRHLLIAEWQNELKSIAERFKAEKGDNGTSCLGQGVDIIDENTYKAILHLPYSIYMQGNISDEALNPLIERIQKWVNGQFPQSPEQRIKVKHEWGGID